MFPSMRSLLRLVVCAVAAVLIAGPALQSGASANFSTGNVVSTSMTVEGGSAGDQVSLLSHHPEEDPAAKARSFEERADELAKKGKHGLAAKAYEQAAHYWKKAGQLDKAKAASEKAAEQQKLARTADR